MNRRRGFDLNPWIQAAQVCGFLLYVCILLLFDGLKRIACQILVWASTEEVVAWVSMRWNSSNLGESLNRLWSDSAEQAAQSRPRAATSSDCRQEDDLLHADAPQLIRAKGYPCEVHYVEACDGFILALHRIPHGRFNDDEQKEGERSEFVEGSMHSPPADIVCSSTGLVATHPRPVVFLMHGFLQSSESFLVAKDNLAFTLADAGFDVWLGNARGNKYSSRHRSLDPSCDEYWDWCMDDIAMKDLPVWIRYVTTVAGVPSLSCIGFSQGSAIGLTSLSIHPHLQHMVDCFIALAPPSPGVHCFANPILDTIAKSWPQMLYLVLGRKALFYPHFHRLQNWLSTERMVSLIEASVTFLFGWKCRNIPTGMERQRMFMHVYSMASVKSLVHWMQIMQSKQYQMYEQGGVGKRGGMRQLARAVVRSVLRRSASSSKQSAAVLPAPLPSEVNSSSTASTPPSSSVRSPHDNSPVQCHPTMYARAPTIYPLSQLRLPLYLFCSQTDSMSDVAWLRMHMPTHAQIAEVDVYEHMDFLYATDAPANVYSQVVDCIRKWAKSSSCSNADSLLPRVSDKLQHSAQLHRSLHSNLAGSFVNVAGIRTTPEERSTVSSTSIDAAAVNIASSPSFLHLQQTTSSSGRDSAASSRRPSQASMSGSEWSYVVPGAQHDDAIVDRGQSVPPRYLTPQHHQHRPSSQHKASSRHVDQEAVPNPHTSASDRLVMPGRRQWTERQWRNGGIVNPTASPSNPAHPSHQRTVSTPPRHLALSPMEPHSSSSSTSSSPRHQQLRRPLSLLPLSFQFTPRNMQQTSGTGGGATAPTMS